MVSFYTISLFLKKLFLKIDFFQPGLDNLDQLVLNDNKLEHLGEDYFTGISKLTTLYLDQNKIKTINAKAFNGIEGKYLLYTSPFTQKLRKLAYLTIGFI